MRASIFSKNESTSTRLAMACALGICLALTACRPQTRDWQRIDLARQIAKGATGGSDSAAVVTRFLGEPVVRGTRANGSPWTIGSRVQALELAIDASQVWTLDLGTEAYFSFVPLSFPMGPCQPRYRVAIRQGDAETWLHDAQIERSAPRFHATATVVVDLGAYPDQEVELRIESRWQGSSCPSDATLAWGSPAIYHLQPEDKERYEGPPNVLVIGLDTMRADHLGIYGRTPSATPALDRFAAESDVWLDAYSVFNVTNPSFASIFTGLYGKNHGVYDLNTPLPAERLTLAEIYQKAGFRTHAVVSAYHMAGKFSGLNQGFDSFNLPPRGNRAAERSVDLAMSWMQDVEARPFFMFLHLFDVHTPYTPPEPFALGLGPAEAPGLSPTTDWAEYRSPGPRQFEDAKLGGHADLYLDEVAYLDRQLGRLFDFLERRGQLENTVIALVADHGENLGEQGVFFRHAGLWDATLRVPLMIRWPGPRHSARGQQRSGLVQTIDLFPTLLGFSGLEIPPQDGKDLVQLTAPGQNGRRLVFAEAVDDRAHMVRNRQYLLSRIPGDHFLLENGAAYLFDTHADPEQHDNLAGQGLEVEAQLGEALDRWRAIRGPAAVSMSKSSTP